MTKRQRIADDLRGQISSRALAPGAVLPSEPELAALHKVSRDTVRWALRDLESEGLVVTRLGRFGGRYVREHAPLELNLGLKDSQTWAADIARLGGDYRAEVSVEEDEESDLLIRRVLRLVNARPHSLVVLTFPLAIIAGAAYADGLGVAPAARLAVEEDIPEGAAEYLKELGWTGMTEAGIIGARMPMPSETEQLAIPAGVPVLAETWTGAQGRTAVYESVRILPADRTQFRLHF